MTKRKAPCKSYADDVIPESCYVDHAIVNSRIGDRHFCAAFTPHGIHGMEQGLTEALFECLTMAELEGMRSIIRKNRHLHKRIKRKLLAKADIVGVPAVDRYRDMKDYHCSWWPRRLTQQGIREIDKGFVDRIMDGPTPEQAKKLRNDIERNEHLHLEIKENLLANLDARLRSDADERPMTMQEMMAEKERQVKEEEEWNAGGRDAWRAKEAERQISEQ